MDINIKTSLTEAGIDADNLLDLFLNNTDMIFSFLKDFVNDKNYETLTLALQNGDCDLAFHAAHTLKGICGNLSITGLMPILSRQVEALRNGNLKEATQLMPALAEEYDKVVAIIRSL